MISSRYRQRGTRCRQTGRPRASAEVRVEPVLRSVKPLCAGEIPEDAKAS
ncbi:hypothetical protein KCP70_08705 [Salmonella enterica subsp. enterica]|nr:hypothetical protein KCP70_08705 [Salmonella enterica subsp. enterica]